MKLNPRRAQAVIDGAEHKAHEIGVPVTIAVLDAGGHLKAFKRMDGAVLASIGIAMKKAKTALLFEANSEAVREYCKPGAPAQGLQLTNGGLATFAGGIPLKLAETISNADVKKRIVDYRKMAIPAEAIASAMAYAIGQPSNVDINEILIRPTAQPN
jgi:uncharacterized protein GlcG (DUF336 family)